MKIIPENIVAELELETPLDWKLSKNRKITRSKQGQMVFNKNKSQVDNLTNEIFYLYRNSGGDWKDKHKTWIFITLHKLNNRGDCANMVDSISDAVKKAIAIDDCWYSFVVDQVIDKKEVIEIRILQEERDHE